MALSRIVLVAHDPAALAGFYEAVLGFSRADAAPACGGLGLSAAVGLRYGDSEIAIVGCAPPGAGYPADVLASDMAFQHFAIVVPDIEVAYRRLTEAEGWRAISNGGPVKLPESSGGVWAFKFRDPEGHPLELLQFPQIAPARIDHTAIVVADTAASVAFYAGFGLRIKGETLNWGPAQAALDGLRAPVVRVNRLGDAAGKLHLELLCYEGKRAAAVPRGPQDVASTKTVFTGAEVEALTRDPDGHEILQVEG